MTSPVRQADTPGTSANAFRDISALNFNGESPAVPAASALTALSLEFVAKPETAASAPTSLLSAIPQALEELTGFAGSMVMISDQEARLITVVIFWKGCDGRKGCAQSMRRVRALIAPYVDRCLRVQTKLAHLPVLQVHAGETKPLGASFIVTENIAQEANVCVA